jgi:hypothetical protein
MIPSKKQISRFRRGRVSAAKEVRKQLRIRNNLERLFFRKMTSLFGRFVNTKAYLYREFGQYDLTTSTRDLQAELFPVVLSHYRRVFKAIYDENSKTNRLEELKEEAIVFGRNVDLEPIIEEYFRTREPFVLAGISSSLAKKVEDVINEGRAEGLTLVEIARNIESKVRPITRSRAATIARTETHNAAGHAHHRYYQQVATDYGSKLKKRWAAANDGRTRTAHQIANGQIRDMDEPFEVGGTQMMHTGDPDGGAANNINCRCVIIYVDELDVVEN